MSESSDTSASTLTSPSATGEPLLKVDGLTSGYNGVPVIYEVSLTVRRGETVLVVGSNGAGKTTTLRSIAGLLPRHAGAVYLDGQLLDGGKAWQRSGAGLSFMPAERFTFADLSVDENLELGAFSVSGASTRAERKDRVLTLFPRLAERRSQLAGTMSGGEQRMLSVGMAMMSGPRLLLLDEPSLGLAPVIVQEIMGTIRTLVEAGELSVLMVEQNIGQGLGIADRVYVLRSGRILLEESAAEMAARDDYWHLF